MDESPSSFFKPLETSQLVHYLLLFALGWVVTQFYCFPDFGSSFSDRIGLHCRRI